MSGRDRLLIALDRDGTIIVDRGYLSQVANVAFEANAIAGLKALAALPATLVVMTNQSGIARGFFEEAAVDAVHRHIDAMLRAEGVMISAWHHCPHLPTDRCDCRKPAPGMLHAAAAAEGADITRAVMIGDKITDVQAASAAGATGILVMTGEGARWAEQARAEGHIVARDLVDAARMISSLHA